jgi:predicted Zn-dependent protease
MVRPVLIAAAVSAAGVMPLLSVDDEVRLGRQAQKEVRAQVPSLQDPTTVSYVESIGRRLAAHARGPRYPYSFSVANHGELNAFALPGGPIWIHRGILHAAADEAQLAGVLAHEIAHISERHAADRMSKQLVANGLLGLLGAMLGSGGGARTARIGAQVLANGYLLKFSRDDERDADRVGVQIVRRAGWDPRGLAEFMEMLQRQQRRAPGSVAVFLSSHPAPGERATELRRRLAAADGGRRDSARFRAVKARVQKLPPPARMRRR